MKSDFKIPIVIVEHVRDLALTYEKFFKIGGLEVIAKLETTMELFEFLKSKEAKRKLMVLLDSEIPHTDVVEVARQLKQTNQEQKIVLLTVTEDDLDLLDARNEIFDALLQKPFTMSELLHTIEKTLSPLSIKGSKIFSEKEQIGDLLNEILISSKEKLRSVSPPSLFLESTIPEHASLYLAAVSRGLKVYVITEITEETLYYSKLLLGHGINIRHLTGILPNFVIWDEEHLIEGLKSSIGSPNFERLLYSNSSSDIERSQYLFDDLWEIAMPAGQRITELESRHYSGSNLSRVSGKNSIVEVLARLIRESTTFVDSYISPEWESNVAEMQLLEARIDAISKSVPNRILLEITKENLRFCEELAKIGVGIRHLSGIKGGFILTGSEIVEFTLLEDREAGQQPQAILSNNSDLILQHKSIFDNLWNIAVPAAYRIKEIEKANPEPKAYSDSRNKGESNL